MSVRLKKKIYTKCLNRKHSEIKDDNEHKIRKLELVKDVITTNQFENRQYVLFLVYVDDDWMDIAENVYPQEGYVEAKQFTKDTDISCGLCGIFDEGTKSFTYEQIDSGHWLVVKTEINDDLIKTDYDLENYKFNTGFIVHSGDYESARKYFAMHKNDDSMY